MHQLTRTTSRCPDDRCRAHTQRHTSRCYYSKLFGFEPSDAESLHAGLSLKYCMLMRIARMCTFFKCLHVTLCLCIDIRTHKLRPGNERARSKTRFERGENGVGKERNTTITKLYVGVRPMKYHSSRLQRSQDMDLF